MSTTEKQFDFDPDALRAKYRKERENAHPLPAGA